MYLVRLMWRSTSESKAVHRRYSWLSQAWRTAQPIRIISAVSNWFRRRTSHALNSLNSIRLMWSTASETGLTNAIIATFTLLLTTSIFTWEWCLMHQNTNKYIDKLSCQMLQQSPHYPIPPPRKNMANNFHCLVLICNQDRVSKNDIKEIILIYNLFFI